jgi:GT2 family glycosyltransferase
VARSGAHGGLTVAGPKPAASVIVATRDRPDTLDACLDSLAALRPPPDGFEVVVVDDGGRVALEPVLAAVADRVDVRLVRRPRPGGPAAARNEGARHARAAWLGFTDDDCRVEPGWLATLAAAVRGDEAVAAGGATRAGRPENPWARASAAVEAAVYAHANRDPARATFLTPKNLLVPAAGFADVGGFDAAFRWSEDRDFCDRWLASGRRLAYVASAVVLHDRPLSAGGFWRQHLEYGRGSRRFHATRRARGRPGLRPDPRFYAGLVRQASAPRELALVVGAQIATAAGYLAGGRPDLPGSERARSTAVRWPGDSSRAESSARLTEVGRDAR